MYIVLKRKRSESGLVLSSGAFSLFFLIEMHRMMVIPSAPGKERNGCAGEVLSRVADDQGYLMAPWLKMG